ncbi:MAG: hypothetical protein P4M11_15190 [Candidatus Pacebacteria bacterium]|nr:hypothetical protein [Candidatus Paceibacterota bacterium]
MNYCTMFIKMDRKQVLAMLESDQGKLTKAIYEERAQMKTKIRRLYDMSPDVLQIDPYVKDLIQREARIAQREQRTGKKVHLAKIEEINSDDEAADDDA